MAIKISGTTVIDDSRNYVGINSLGSSTGSVQSWTSGQKSINVDGTTGNILVDGTVTASTLATYLG